MTSVQIVSIGAESVAQQGFFCRKSKMKTEGNRRKLAWATDGFENGLGIEILYEEGRSVGFVEYAPAENAWRAVRAPGYLIIHCIWVVGRAKGKGYGAALLERVEAKARDLDAVGVAMVTSSGVWLADDGLLLGNGYEPVDEAPHHSGSWRRRSMEPHDRNSPPTGKKGRPHSVRVSPS